MSQFGPEASRDSATPSSAGVVSGVGSGRPHSDPAASSDPTREAPGMECPRCHAQTREGLRFCEDCGSRLTLSCSQCGAELGPGKRFCGSCGASVEGPSAARTPSPEAYTPKHL